jgi:putative endonuclease
MASWFVYIVRCRDGSLYTGISTDVRARIAVHNDGRGARYTRARRPVTLVYVERRRSRSTALRREAAIKALPRAEKCRLVERPEARGDVTSHRVPSPRRRRTDLVRSSRGVATVQSR